MRILSAAILFALFVFLAGCKPEEPAPTTNGSEPETVTITPPDKPVSDPNGTTENATGKEEGETEESGATDEGS